MFESLVSIAGGFTQKRMRICTLNRYFTLLKRVILMALMGPSFSIAQENQPNKNNKIHIVKTTDFEISGKGTAAQWDQTNWVELTKRGKGRTSYETRAKNHLLRDRNILSFSM